jgi:penicillin-binding protein 1C
MTERGSRLRRWRRRAAWVLGTYAVLRIVFWCIPRPPLAARFGTSTAVYDSDGRLLRLTLAPDEQYRLWTPLGKISPQLVEAVLRYEDRWFPLHPGVNPIAIGRAVRMTYGGGGRRVGGSTVTMQLARRLWRLETRTIGGKLVQMARALQLEMQYSKDEILEAYLNTAPYGGNVEGVGAASLILFGKPPASLTLTEALTLAVIPQNPTRRGAPSGGAEAAEGASLARARSQLVATWLEAHPEHEKEAALLRVPIALRPRGALPFHAPHFVDAVLASQPDNRPAEIRTTLDLRLQRLLERHAKAWVARQRRIGITNTAAMLVDWRTMDVKAQLGSVDWFDDTIDGKVNGALAKRSPGSALKPFVYALAIDQGVIHPETTLKDAPASFGAYSPENFDGKFAGPIPAREALVRSRNVPAVMLAGKLNRPSVYELLKQGGVSRLADESRYGLGIALGAAEVTMEELVALYAALGAGGVWRPLRHRATDPTLPIGDGVRLLSEEASFVTTDMLRENPRPDRSRALDEQRVIPAWKTGTSWGFRDAWAVGLVGRYVLAVWVGNFDGEGNPAFVGVQAAAPLFFEIVDSLVAADPSLANDDAARRPPRGLRRVHVCAVSGQLPTPHCQRTKPTWFLPGRSPIAPCDVHRAIVIDDKSGRRACAATTGPTHTEVFEVWPSDLAKLFAQAGLPRRALPPPAPGCDDVDDTGAGAPPKITSPLRGVTYTLRPGKPDGTRVALSAITDGDARELHWFVNQEYVGKAMSGETIFYEPRPGTFVVRAIDDRGRTDSRELRVELAP